ncbi:MAG: MFS transporter [Candidatus Uhrbacteria bacterium]|nr:MFS transporter [Candidatus Uhrbacteria bacterium]
MPTLHHLISHAQKYGEQHRPLYLFGLCIFFFIIFDGIIAYMLPVVMSRRGFSTTTIGFIISASSIVGAAFDFLLARALRAVNIRRLFLFVFLIGALVPAIVWRAETVSMFLVAVALGGIYFDLYVFSTFDFVARYTKRSEHASSFGFIQICASLGGLIAPIIAMSAFILDGSGRPFFIAWAALAVSALCFLSLSAWMKNTLASVEQTGVRKKTFMHELRLWKNIGILIRSPLVMTLSLHLFNGLFWTLAPLYPVNDMPFFNAVLLVAYGLPILLVGWFVGPITRQFGKKQTAFGALLIGSLILSLVSSLQNPSAIILCVFLASSFFGIAWPSISGAYADYISETPNREEEIEGVQDFFGNGGYIIGPITAGLLADVVGIPMTFTLFGVLGAIIGAALLSGGKKSITIPS